MTKPDNSTNKPATPENSANEGGTSPLADIQTEAAPTSATGPGLDLKEEAGSKPNIGLSNGKTKSSNLRALKHGAYYKGLLPWESHEDFDALCDDVCRDWNTQGVLENETALTLSQWIWKKRRVHIGGQIIFYRSSIAKELKSGATSLEELIAHESEVPDQVRTLVASALKLSESLVACSDNFSNHYYWTETTEGKDIQMALAKMKSDYAKLAGLVRDLALTGFPAITTFAKETAHLFERAYQPDEIEKETKLLAMIDHEIDKTMKRMMLLKTFKEATRHETGPRLIADAPPVAPVEYASQIESPNESIEANTKKST